MWKRIQCFFDHHEMKETGNYAGQVYYFDKKLLDVLIGRCKHCNDMIAMSDEGKIFLVKKLIEEQHGKRITF